MSSKMKIKGSEARIMIYLSVVHPTRKYPSAIANALEMDYGYLLHVLKPMVSKGWLLKQQNRRQVFYTLTKNAPLESAKNEFNTQNLQLTLENNYTTEEKKAAEPDEVEENPNTIEDTYKNAYSDTWENNGD